MRIAIDARMIRPGSMHGIARYVHNLLKCFQTQGPGHEYFILVNKNSPLNRQVWPDHIHLIKVWSKWISFAEQLELPARLRKLKVDLFHAPSFVAPIFCPCPMIMTIHDLNHLVLPQFYTPLHLFYYHTFVKICIERSRFILTVSNFSKAEIVRNLEVEPEKVFVTYNGISEQYQVARNSNWVEYIRDIYELPREFIFCLANNKPHKNIYQLVRAYCFSKTHVPLVLASNCDPRVIKLAESFGKKHLIYFSKFIADEHLPTVYSMTRVFVYPSTYEGFGLPPLEALACGAPVVVAKSASLPEVVGPHAIYMDPFDYLSIAKALEDALVFTSETDTLELQSKRIAYARKFSWQEMAEKTLKIYSVC